jgi:hypothetical protein
VNTFRDGFLEARRRIEAGDDPEPIVAALLELAESEDEIDMAEALYPDEDDDE